MSTHHSAVSIQTELDRMDTRQLPAMLVKYLARGDTSWNPDDYAAPYEGPDVVVYQKTSDRVVTMFPDRRPSEDQLYKKH